MAEVPAVIRQVVYERDGLQCQACGVSVAVTAWRSIQHRHARGTGGQNALSNLVTLCGSATSAGCHLKCEQRDEEMHDRGFWLNSWQDPAATPVRTWDDQVKYLIDDGSIKIGEKDDLEDL